MKELAGNSRLFLISKVQRFLCVQSTQTEGNYSNAIIFKNYWTKEPKMSLGITQPMNLNYAEVRGIVVALVASCSYIVVEC